MDRARNNSIPWKQLSTKEIISGISDMVLHWIMRALPIDICSYIGGIGGKFLGPKHKDVDTRLRKNIQFLKPNLSARELDQIVKKWWENHGRVLAEYSVLRRIWKSNRTTIQGIEHITYAKKTGRPTIALFLHTGNWEVIGPKLLSLVDNRGILIYQELDDHFKMKIAKNIRSRYTNHLITQHFSAGRKIYKKLISGYHLAMAADECVNGKLNAPSFGRPLPRSGNISFALRFAKLTNALILPAYTTRTNGARFILTILPSMDFDFNNFNDDELQDAQIKIDTVIDKAVRENLDQWYYATASDLFENA